MARHALCIGINDYPGTKDDLNGCVNDAKDWAAALGKRDFSVQKLINKDATGDSIRKAINSIISGAGSGDSIIIQYSGHGSYVPDENGDEPDGTDECICPYDVKRKGTITDDELFELLSARQRSVKVVMISDSCNSGSVARFAPITTPPTIRGSSPPQRKVRFLPPAAFLSARDVGSLGVRLGPRRSSPPGRYACLLMAGCQEYELSWDAVFQGRPNGAFTFVALDAFKSLSSNASYLDWFRAIRKRLPSQQYPQTPNLYGSNSMKRWKILS